MFDTPRHPHVPGTAAAPCLLAARPHGQCQARLGCRTGGRSARIARHDCIGGEEINWSNVYLEFRATTSQTQEGHDLCSFSVIPVLSCFAACTCPASVGVSTMGSNQPHKLYPSVNTRHNETVVHPLTTGRDRLGQPTSSFQNRCYT